MLNCGRFEPSVRRWHGFLDHTPESPAGRMQSRPPLRTVEALQQQMIQQERGIERRVAEMDDLEIDSHYRCSIDEEVFGAPVAMHQGEAATLGFFD